MKILHIVDNLGLGGAQTVVKGIFEGQKENSDIFLYGLRKREINMEINHKNIFTNNSKNKFSFPIFKLKKIIQKNNIEILHCHLPKSQFMGGILKMLFFPNIKLIFHEHGPIGGKSKMYAFLMNFFRNKVNVYISISEFMLKYIFQKTNFDKKKVTLLYNFVDINIFKKLNSSEIEKIKDNLKIENNKFIIGFAARIIERKGWREFVESAKIVGKKYPNIVFLLAGDGPEKEKLLKKIQGEKSIKYIGYTDNMVGFYNILDCFIFPSRVEPLGLTGLEANACEIPVIVSNIDGPNEIMLDGKNALLFEKQNVDDLVEKIEMIYNRNELREKLIIGGKEAAEKYSLEKYLVNLNKIYEKI